VQLAPITRIIYFYSGPVMSQVPRLDLVLTAHDQAYTHNSSVQNLRANHEVLWCFGAVSYWIWPALNDRTVALLTSCFPHMVNSRAISFKYNTIYSYLNHCQIGCNQSPGLSASSLVVGRLQTSWLLPDTYWGISMLFTSWERAIIDYRTCYVLPSLLRSERSSRF